VFSIIKTGLEEKYYKILISFSGFLRLFWQSWKMRQYIKRGCPPLFNGFKLNKLKNTLYLNESHNRDLLRKQLPDRQ